MNELPLFPLPDTVIFPGMTLPLMVFEARYKELVQYCLDRPEEKKRFVIALAGESSPIRDHDPPLPSYGSYVDILSVTENRDGTFELMIHGRDRCRIEVTRELSVAEPDGEKRPLFFVADSPAPLERDDPNHEQLAAWDALEIFRQYARKFFAGDAVRQIDDAVPDDLIFQASFICANLRVPAASRQVLLEAPSLLARFELAANMMKERLDRPQAEEV